MPKDKDFYVILFPKSAIDKSVHIYKQNYRFVELLMQLVEILIFFHIL